MKINLLPTLVFSPAYEKQIKLCMTWLKTEPTLGWQQASKRYKAGNPTGGELVRANYSRAKERLGMVQGVPSRLDLKQFDARLKFVAAFTSLHGYPIPRMVRHIDETCKRLFGVGVADDYILEIACSPHTGIPKEEAKQIVQAAQAKDPQPSFAL